MACRGLGFGDLEWVVWTEHAVVEERSTGENDLDGRKEEGVRANISGSNFYVCF